MTVNLNYLPVSEMLNIASVGEVAKLYNFYTKFNLMRISLLLILLTVTTSCFSQDTMPTTQSSTPKFNTAGEQEVYNVKQMFKNEYKKQQHKKYTGTIKTVNKVTYQFDTLTMTVNYTLPELRSIFAEGILYPSLFGSEDSLSITDLKELKYVNIGPKSKRFSLWLFRKWLANPQVYYFELTNEKATIATDLKEFIKGSKLTFFKPGSIII